MLKENQQLSHLVAVRDDEQREGGTWNLERDLLWAGEQPLDGLTGQRNRC